ncbi:MAG: GNAT family N-acetyltransferase [Flavobacteriaceae bacterium]
MQNIIYKKAESISELNQILQLQQINSPESISEEESIKEGFVTAKHSFEILKQMNDICAHTIAMHNDKVVGYALSMDKTFKNDIKVLTPMFNKIEMNISSNTNYIVMGQICIDKQYRMQGIFKGLYDFMRSQMKLKYDVIITEVDIKNTRSMNAHKAIGFKVLYSYRSNNQNWEILSWDIKTNN